MALMPLITVSGHVFISFMYLKSQKLFSLEEFCEKDVLKFHKIHKKISAPRSLFQ